MPDTNVADEVNSLKAEGNALYGKKQFYEAIEKYTHAIALDDANVALYSNRSAAYTSLQSYGRPSVIP